MCTGDPTPLPFFWLGAGMADQGGSLVVEPGQARDALVLKHRVHVPARGGLRAEGPGLARQGTQADPRGACEGEKVAVGGSFLQKSVCCADGLLPWLSQTSTRLSSPFSGVAQSFDQYICLV